MTARERVIFDKGFDHGYFCALATVMHQHDQSTIVEDALKCNYKTIDGMKRMGVDPFDIEALEPICKEIERKKSLYE